MTDQQPESAVLHPLLYHDHAPLAALVLALTAVISVPVTELTAIPGIFSTVLLAASTLWILFGATVGWLPR